MLTKAAFDDCIRGIIPASLLDQDEKTSFSVLLSSIFFSFDRDNRYTKGEEVRITYLVTARKHTGRRKRDPFQELRASAPRGLPLVRPEKVPRTPSSLKG